MKNVKLKSARLQTLLSNTIDLCYQGKIKELTDSCRPQLDKLIPDFHACSDQYLFEAFKKPLNEFGYPRSMHGFGMTQIHPKFEDTLAPLRQKVARIGNYLGTPKNALLMGYPDNGYIGWHHNGNAPGYNVLLTYSQDGDGHFSYWDYATKSIVRLQDVPGWQCRVGYYPDIVREKHKVFWHMAETKKHRMTFAWVINHKEMWKSMIDEITEGDYDPSILG